MISVQEAKQIIRNLVFDSTIKNVLLQDVFGFTLA